MCRVLMLADGDGAVRVVQDVVGHAAEDRATDRTQPTRPHHHHRHVLLQRRVHDRLARVLAELHHHASAHLSTATATTINRCKRTRATNSPTHSFIPGLKPPFLQILPTAALPFSLPGFTTWIPQTEDCTVREKLLNMNFTEF